MGLPPLNGQSTSSSFVTHPSDVSNQLILKAGLEDGRTPPPQELQPRAPDIDQPPRGCCSLANGLPPARHILEIVHRDASGRAGSQMLSEPQQLVGLHTQRRACRALICAMLEIALALDGKRRIAVSTAGGLAGE